MNFSLPEILYNALTIFFLIFSVIGIIISFILLKAPQTLLKFDNYLNQNVHVDSKGLFLDSKIDIENVFFNHHISTSLVMIILSVSLFMSNSGIDTSSLVLSKWIIFFVFIKAVFYFFAVAGCALGLFILLSPKNAFLFIRMLNRYIYTISTKDVDIFLQNEVVEKKVYLRYNVLFSAVVFLFSVILLVLLLRQMFF
ncbi:MAG: hypothetical protein JW928_03265 [Candidatus Aureabacteria bacterium]|nr:hypothetical protein [Candidatus Auribacterota bacterium]